MGKSYKTLQLFGWHGVVIFGKRSVHCEIRLLIRAWEALEYLCGYERDAPKMYYMYLYKDWLFKESHEENMAQFPIPMLYLLRWRSEGRLSSFSFPCMQIIGTCGARDRPSYPAEPFLARKLVL